MSKVPPMPFIFFFGLLFSSVGIGWASHYLPVGIEVHGGKLRYTYIGLTETGGSGWICGRFLPESESSFPDQLRGHKAVLDKETSTTAAVQWEPASSSQGDRPFKSAISSCGTSHAGNYPVPCRAFHNDYLLPGYLRKDDKYCEVTYEGKKLQKTDFDYLRWSEFGRAIWNIQKKKPGIKLYGL